MSHSKPSSHIMQKQTEASFIAGLTLCGHYHASTGSRNMPRHVAETIRELNESTFSPSVRFFVLVASFPFNVKLLSSPGQTAGSPARLTPFLFIIFPYVASQLPPTFVTNQTGSKVLCLHWDEPLTASDQSSADECG